jgi:hypothetical protein
MPRFTILDLLKASVLIAAGVAPLCIFFGPLRNQAGLWALVALPMINFSGALIGAGLFTPFQRPLLGVVLGIVAQFGFYACLAVCFLADG